MYSESKNKSSARIASPARSLSLRRTPPRLPAAWRRTNLFRRAARPTALPRRTASRPSDLRHATPCPASSCPADPLAPAKRRANSPEKGPLPANSLYSDRSQEHTSQLHSPDHLVSPLLLEQ